MSNMNNKGPTTWAIGFLWQGAGMEVKQFELDWSPYGMTAMELAALLNAPKRWSLYTSLEHGGILLHKPLQSLLQMFTGPL